MFYLDGSLAEGGPGKKNFKAAPGVTWEWEGDGGQWTAFSVEHSKTLSESLMNGEGDITLQVSKTIKMKICFEAMTQTNVRTGWQRNIRCVPPSVTPGPSGGAQHGWEWENDGGEWTAFSPATHRFLTACQLCGLERVSLQLIPGNSNTVDLKAMKCETGDGKTLGIRFTPLPG